MADSSRETEFQDHKGATRTGRVIESNWWGTPTRVQTTGKDATTYERDPKSGRYYPENQGGNPK
jgi:hypothetical protein